MSETLDENHRARDFLTRLAMDLDKIGKHKDARACGAIVDDILLPAYLNTLAPRGSGAVGVKAADEGTFQSRVAPWMQACFGPEISNDRLERGDRLLEEVLELLQSGDYPQERVAALTAYTFGRDKGEPHQEVGGVQVTLAAYCLAHDLDMHQAAEDELARIWTKVEKIRAKQAAKPTGSALPVAALSAIDHTSNEPVPAIHPKWKPDDKSGRHPQTVDEWDWHQDGPDNGPLERSARRLNVSCDYDDPRAPDQMALVFRIDLSRVLGDRVFQGARAKLFLDERKSVTDAAWQELLDKDDRTSPAEYPDMALITKDELWHLLIRNAPVAASPSIEQKAGTGPRIKPEIIRTLREWAEFEQDGGNVEQGAAIDIILDWYDRQLAFPSKKLPGYIDPDNGQYVGPFTECRCGNTKLELRGKFWCCTRCGVSYGEHALLPSNIGSTTI